MSEEPEFGTDKLIGICRYTGDWIAVESTDESCPHGDCDCGLAFYTAGIHLADPDYRGHDRTGAEHE